MDLKELGAFDFTNSYDGKIILKFDMSGMKWLVGMLSQAIRSPNECDEYIISAGCKLLSPNAELSRRTDESK